MSPDPAPADDRRGLGLDAGGTATRWALAAGGGRVLVEGTAAPLSALQLGSAAGRGEIAAVLADIAAAAGQVRAVVAGFTGFDVQQAGQLAEIVARGFGLAPAAVRAMSDIELTCRAAFAPGGGAVVYAGTGAIAAFLDAQGVLHRAGGRGAVIDDAGGGHWIAAHALRAVWRAEDARSGAWQESTLARRLFDRIGGSEWALTRHWVYGAETAATRGRLGTLALAVAAAAAADDGAALAILESAGVELARLAQALLGRVGVRPLALAGRVFELHPAVEASLRAALPPGLPVERIALPAHHAAARLALQPESRP